MPFAARARILPGSTTRWGYKRKQKRSRERQDGDRRRLPAFMWKAHLSSLPFPALHCSDPHLLPDRLLRTACPSEGEKKRHKKRQREGSEGAEKKKKKSLAPCTHATADKETHWRASLPFPQPPPLTAPTPRTAKPPTRSFTPRRDAGDRVQRQQNLGSGDRSKDKGEEAEKTKQKKQLSARHKNTHIQTRKKGRGAEAHPCTRAVARASRASGRGRTEKQEQTRWGEKATR